MSKALSFQRAIHNWAKVVVKTVTKEYTNSLGSTGRYLYYYYSRIGYFLSGITHCSKADKSISVGSICK